MAYEKQIEDFAEAKATWLSSSDVPLLHTKQLVRGWKGVTDAEKAANEAYLNAYVSPKNLVPSTTITDPQADGSGTLEGGLPKNVFTGLWRHVSTTWSREDQIYKQILRLGWASTLVADECMIRTGSDQREDARSYTFYWRNIAETAVDACVSGLRAAGELVDPLVQGETKTGTYAISNIVPEQNDDGSYTIAVQAIKVAEISSADDLDNLSPIRKDVHDINNPFGLEGGYTEHIGRKPTDGILLTYRALSMDSRDVLMAITDDEFRLRLSVAERAKYEFVKRELNEDTGNTLTLTVVYQYVPLKFTTPEEDARYVSLERKNQSGKIILTRSWPRIDPSVADTLLTANDNAKVMANIVTDPLVDGKTYTGDWMAKTTVAAETDNDGIRVVQVMTLAGDQKLDIKYGKDPDHLVYEFFRWDYSTAMLNAFMKNLSPEEYTPSFKWEEAEVGKTKLVQVQKNADESFDMHAVYSDTTGLHHLDLANGTLVDVGLTDERLVLGESFGVTNRREHGFNIPVAMMKILQAAYAPSVTLANNVNKVRSFQVQRQTEHVFDFVGEIKDLVPIDSGWQLLVDDDATTVHARDGRYILEASLATDQDFGVPATIPANTLYEKGMKKNEYGSFDGRLVKTLFKNQQSFDAVTSAASETISEENTETAEITDFTTTAGTVRRVEQTPTRVGNMHTKNTIVTPIDQEGSSIESSAAKTVEVTLHSEGEAIVNPAAATGTIRTVVQIPTEAGNFKTTDTIVTPINQDSAGGAASLLETVGIVSKTEGAAVTLPTAAVNVLVNAEEQPTEAGHIRSRVVTSTLLNWTGTDNVISDNGIVKVKQKIFKNLATALTAAEHQEVAIRDNERGAYNGVVTTNELSASAAGEKAQHQSSTVRWDSSSTELRVPAWRLSTDSSATPTITGYNIYKASIARWQLVTTKVTKTYTLTEPVALTVPTATPGASEGAGTTYTADSRPAAPGVWEIVKTETTSSAFSDYLYRNLTWIAWIPQAEGSGTA